tara:strand:+ start:1953 stop:2204 length:252 start_codon:yes stop_codon:yes gene_type:complete
MALNKTIVVDRVEVLERGQIQVRTATVVDEDGTELSRTFHRLLLNPGDDTSGQVQRVQDIAAATWTPQVVADWAAFVAEQEAT